MSDDPVTESPDCGEEDDDFETGHKVFVAGYIPKRYHNSALSSISLDLQPHFYVASNSGLDWDTGETRRLIANSDTMLFFVNEHTLKDTNSLLALQYAWYLMLPILMLRPPRTKLVISRRKHAPEKIQILANGSIVRSPTLPWQMMTEGVTETIDYALLQDVLYEGYKVSLVYDRSAHQKSMNRILRRLATIFSNDVGEPAGELSSNNSAGSFQPLFYLSSTNGSTNHSSRRERVRKHSRMTTSQSASCVRTAPTQITFGSDVTSPNLLSDRLGDDESEAHRYRLKSPPPPNREESCEEAEEDEDEEDEDDVFGQEKESPKDLEETPIEAIPPPTCKPVKAQESVESRRTLSHNSSIERRISLSCLDDLSNYQRTQYLVFPMRDSSKTPYIIKFPEGLEEEDCLDKGSVYGSDTSLEEEAKLAEQITSGIQLDDEYDSPIMSPAPFMDEL